MKSPEQIVLRVRPEYVAVGRAEWTLAHEEPSGADPYPSANLLSLKGGIITNHIKVY